MTVIVSMNNSIIFPYINMIEHQVINIDDDDDDGDDDDATMRIMMVMI